MLHQDPDSSCWYLEDCNNEMEALREHVWALPCMHLEDHGGIQGETQKQYGLDGLDPMEVDKSLPEKLQKCFDVKDGQILQDAISKM